MKRTGRIFLCLLMFIMTCITAGGRTSVFAGAEAEVQIDPDSPFPKGEFYGIWIGAADNLEEAKAQAEEAAPHVGVVQIFLTTDWSNLNTQPWYVLTAGMYASRSEAEMMLPQIQKYDPEAYVKASGSRLGHFYSSPAATTGSVGTGAAPGGWLGTWKAENGEYLEVTQATDSAVSLTYHGFYADGSGMFASPYVLPFLNQEKTICAEKQEVLDKAGWRYEFQLSGDTMIMRSRYPDRNFYRVASAPAAGAGSASGTKTGSPSPFYGIWCTAAKSVSDAQKFAGTMRSKGLPASIYRTSDWSELNTEFWYVVTAGTYATKEAAESALPEIQKSYPDAYVKYTGNYAGH